MTFMSLTTQLMSLMTQVMSVNYTNYVVNDTTYVANDGTYVVNYTFGALATFSSLSNNDKILLMTKKQLKMQNCINAECC
jgi:hypothetical protein